MPEPLTRQFLVDHALAFVTRIEVIGPDGREFVRWNGAPLYAALQDDDRTLKIFLIDRKEERP